MDYIPEEDLDAWDDAVSNSSDDDDDDWDIEEEEEDDESWEYTMDDIFEADSLDEFFDDITADDEYDQLRQESLDALVEEAQELGMGYESTCSDEEIGERAMDITRKMFR